MKNTLRFGLGLVLIAVLLVAPMSASAAAIHTQVTGRLYILPEPPDGPDIRGWDGGSEKMRLAHCRNDVQNYQFETSDARLNGFAEGPIGCEWRFDENWNPVFIHTWGFITIYDAASQPTWECVTTGMMRSPDPYWVNGVCKGVGEYKGLHANLLFGPDHWDDTGWWFEVSGTLLETR